MTGGVEPSQRSKVERVICFKNKGNVLHYADVYFTDVGLLIATYSSAILEGGGSIGHIYGGLVGGLVEAAVEFRANLRKKKSAEQNYEMLTRDQPRLAPSDLFSVAGNVAFLPRADFFSADLMELLKPPTSNTLCFRFLGSEYHLSLERPNQSMQETAAWLSEAKSK